MASGLWRISPSGVAECCRAMPPWHGCSGSRRHSQRVSRANRTPGCVGRGRSPTPWHRGRSQILKRPSATAQPKCAPAPSALRAAPPSRRLHEFTPELGVTAKKPPTSTRVLPSPSRALSHPALLSLRLSSWANCSSKYRKRGAPSLGPPLTPCPASLAARPPPRQQGNARAPDRATAPHPQ